MIRLRRAHLRVPRGLLAAQVAAMVTLAGSALAEEAKGWQPTPPMPEKFDWIQIVSDEWLKGEIIAMYDGTLEFDSDELDDLSFDFADVKQIRTVGVVQVGLLSSGMAVGKLLMDGDEVRVMGEQDRTFAKADVLTITSGEPRESNYWSGKASAGTNFRRGNSEQLESNFRVGLMRRTVRNRIAFDYLGNYNITNDVTAADNQRATIGWDWFLTDRFFVSPVMAEYFRDPFQNIAHRATLGAGVGYQIVDTAKVDWEATVGVAYQSTRFDDVAEGEDDSVSTPAVLVDTVYDHELSGSVDLTVQYRFLIVDEESGQYTHHFVTGLEFDLIGSLDFDVTFVWDRIQKPRPDSTGAVPDQDDFRLNFALGFDF